MTFLYSMYCVPVLSIPLSLHMKQYNFTYLVQGDIFYNGEKYNIFHTL